MKVGSISGALHLRWEREGDPLCIVEPGHKSKAGAKTKIETGAGSDEERATFICNLSIPAQKAFHWIAMRFLEKKSSNCLFF